MSRAKRRGRQPIRPRPTTRRHNSCLSSITHQAPITAGAVPARVKRATDRMVTLTITSTPAGASKARPGLWVSQVQAEPYVPFFPPCRTFFSPSTSSFLHPQGRHHYTITSPHIAGVLIHLLHPFHLPFFSSLQKKLG